MKERYVIAGRLVLLSIMFLLTDCGRNAGHTNGSASVSGVTDLTQLQQAFNRDQGRVRIVALLSPV
jgi:hypothetical protein